MDNRIKKRWILEEKIAKRVTERNESDKKGEKGYAQEGREGAHIKGLYLNALTKTHPSISYSLGISF